MSAEKAKALGVKPLGFFRGFLVAGCEPDEMGIGPVFAVPKLLKRTGKKLADIDIVELNEAFASQVVYCRDKLGLDPAKLNPNGGSISIGHPYGMTGSRCTGHAAARATTQQEALRHRHHVHRRRHGRRGAVRSGVDVDSFAALSARPEPLCSQSGGAVTIRPSLEDGSLLELFANRVHLLTRLVDVGVEVAAMIGEEARRDRRRARPAA